MLEVTRMASADGSRTVANIRSPSSSSEGSSSLSSSSGTRAGGSPTEQSEMRRASNFRVLRSTRISSRQPEQHRPEQRDILTSPVEQANLADLYMRSELGIASSRQADSVRQAKR